MNRYLLPLCILLAGPLTAAPLPENVYFRAMQDEMHRTQKELRVPGNPKPFFTGYKVIATTSQGFAALFGVPVVQSPVPRTNVALQAYVYAGTAKKNSSGFENDAYYYQPDVSSMVPVSYEGLRRVLWRLTDAAYVAAANSYEKKEAYKRRKNITDTTPDFTSAPKSEYVQQIPPFPQLDGAYYQQLVNSLSAMGKQLPFLEAFSTSVLFSQRDLYFLDSEGDFYQYSVPSAQLVLTGSLRNRDGYKESAVENIALAWDQPADLDDLQQKTQTFLDQLQNMYQARKAEPYLGPVLLEPKAAGGFVHQLFILNANNPKPLLSAQRETDSTAGQFKDKLGMRVISHLLDVYDRPQMSHYQGEPLRGFTPVDDEGVTAEELPLVQSGKLTALPAARSPIEGQKRSNGHARMSDWVYPRAILSNVFVEPKQPLPQEALEERFLDRCRELELEYCYIFPRFPAINGGKGELNFAWRVYTADGHKEPVYGLRLENITTRSLRDVLAAGQESRASHFTDSLSRLPLSVVTPALLVDEIEILPTQRKPERKPFVSLP